MLAPRRARQLRVLVRVLGLFALIFGAAAPFLIVDPAPMLRALAARAGVPEHISADALAAIVPPIEGLRRRTYVSENALMPGSAAFPNPQRVAQRSIEIEGLIAAEVWVVLPFCCCCC
jgi:hypothetical protein